MRRYGLWKGGRALCDFDKMAEELQDAGFRAVAVVGLPEIGGYEDEDFPAQCRRWNWVPVEGWRWPETHLIPERIAHLKAQGYRAIKVHPRCLGAMPSVETMQMLLVAVERTEMPVMLCSYPFLSADTFSYIDLLAFVHESLRAAPTAKVMLVHAGATELLRYIEFARMNTNVTLDLSLTLLKYEGSSLDLDLDLAFAFKAFDRRIVIGSDSPEFSSKQVREQVRILSKEISSQQLENIAWRNACSFFNAVACRIE